MAVTAVAALAATGVVVLAATDVAVAAKGPPASLDRGFGKKGIARLGAGTELFGTAVQKDGKVVVVGAQRNKLLVARFTKSGRLDRGFRGGRPLVSGKFSIGRGVAIQRDGKIVVAGYLTDKSAVNQAGMLIQRFTPAGRADRSFSRDGAVTLLPGAAYGAANAVAVASDGKIAVAGSALSAEGVQEVAVARLTKKGALDRRFNGGVRVAEGAQDLGRFGEGLGVAFQSRGRVVVAGTVRPNLQNPQAFVARLSDKGSVDRSFARGEYLLPADVAGGGATAFSALAVDKKGGIVAAGQAAANSTSSAGTPGFALVSKLSAGGAPVRGFSGDGRQTVASARGPLTPDVLPGARGVALAKGGTIVLAGDYNDLGLDDLAVYALTPGGGPKKFGTRGLSRTRPSRFESATANAVAVAPDGGIVAAGTSTDTRTPRGLVLRLRGFGK